MRASGILLAFAACSEPRTDFGPKFYTHAGDRVVCSKGSDREHEWKLPTLTKSLDIAKSDEIVLQTYAHAPSAENSGVDLVELMTSFDYANANGIPMVTFKQLAEGYDGGGWSFSIDDNDIDTWMTWRGQLNAHHAKLTFFVSRYDKFTAAQKAQMKQLAADGHDIQAHGILHLNATLAVGETGFDTYYANEVKPSVDLLVADGYHPVAFAYPYGAHTPDIDAKMKEHFAMLRTTGSSNCY